MSGTTLTDSTNNHSVHIYICVCVCVCVFTLSQLQGWVHQLHHVFNIQHEGSHVCSSEDIHEHWQEVISAVGSSCSAKQEVHLIYHSTFKDKKEVRHTQPTAM